MNIYPITSPTHPQTSLCTICQEEDSPINLKTICPRTSTGSGGHAFHAKCAQEYFAHLRTATCPACRTDLSLVTEAQNVLGALGSKASNVERATDITQVRQNIAQVQRRITQAHQNLAQAQANYNSAMENLEREPNTIQLLLTASAAYENLQLTNQHLDSLMRHLQTLQNNETTIA